MVATPWQVLDIAPTDDKTLIKRAYAAKLKKTRPDEDPQGFQLLHQSYKHALAIAPHINEQIDELAYEVDEETQGSSCDTIEADTREQGAYLEPEYQDTQVSDEQFSDAVQDDEVVQALFERQWQAVVEPIDEIITSHVRRNKISEWEALAQSSWYSLNNNQLDMLGLYVFDKLSSHNMLSKGKRKKYNRITKPIINLLNKIFLWHLQEPHVRYFIGDEKRCDIIFKQLNIEYRNPLSAVKGGTLSGSGKLDLPDDGNLSRKLKQNWETHGSGSDLGIGGIIWILFFVGSILRAIFER